MRRMRHHPTNTADRTEQVSFLARTFLVWTETSSVADDLVPSATTAVREPGAIAVALTTYS